MTGSSKASALRQDFPEWVACVDFGAANTKAALVRRGASNDVRPLPIGTFSAGYNSYLSPSQIWIDRNRIVFGGHAARKAADNSDPGRRAAISFKTLLGGRALGQVLDQSPPRTIDPSQLFSNGDLIRLYIAHAITAMKNAALSATNAPFHLAAAELRYTQPLWMANVNSSTQTLFESIYDEAIWLSHEMEDVLLGPDGAGVRAARDALDTYKSLPATGLVAGCVHEAIAAATSFGGTATQHDVFALDIGAGTTDMAGFSFSGDHKGKSAREIPEARRMIGVAGDAIDTIVMNAFLSRSTRATSVDAQQRFWELLQPTIRPLKESLFQRGQATFQFDGESISLARSSIENEADYKKIAGLLRVEFANALAAMEKVVASNGTKQIALIAAGGGSQLPFVRRMIASTKPRSERMRFIKAVGAPAWLNALTRNDDLQRATPLLLTCIGGALAHPDFVQRGPQISLLAGYAN